jgi:hypothetical protein
MVETLTLLFAAVTLACVAIFGLALRKVLAAPRAATPGSPEAGPSVPGTEADLGTKLVAREVLDDEGKRVGETVRVQGDDVVLKGPEGFYVVPRTELKEEGERLRAHGVDWVLARNRGEIWRREHEDVMKVDDKGMPVLER